jgi:hypothetical protein
MKKVVMTFIISIFMLLSVCFIGSLVLAKDTKEFHISFTLKGFEISGSFYETE